MLQHFLTKRPPARSARANEMSALVINIGEKRLALQNAGDTVS